MADQIQAGSLGGAKARRLAYIDWMRGLACVLMFQAHCYSAWLNPDARKSEFYRWSQAAATLPAPLFIFLAGISSGMAAVAAGVVYQRRAHLRAAAALVIPHFPMDSIRLRGAGAGFPVVFWFRQEERSVVFCCCWRGGGDRLRALAVAGWRAGAVVFGGDLRLLAHEPGIFPDALRNFAGAAFFGLCVVPVGPGAEGIQPDYSVGDYFAAGLLGAHRVCLRALFHFAEGPVQHLKGDGGPGDYFSGLGGGLRVADVVEEAAS